MKPVWPFLLHLYGDYAGKRLSRHDLLTLTRLVTAYVMRRAVCGYRPAAPPPVFATASRSVDPECYVESVRAYFLCLPDGSAFLSDETFRAELVSRNMYRFRHRDALLERLENDGRKERVPLSSSRSITSCRRANACRTRGRPSSGPTGRRPGRASAIPSAT